MEKMKYVFYAQCDFNPISQTWSCKEFERVENSQRNWTYAYLKWDDDILCAKDENIFKMAKCLIEFVWKLFWETLQHSRASLDPAVVPRLRWFYGEMYCSLTKVDADNFKYWPKYKNVYLIVLSTNYINKNIRPMGLTDMKGGQVGYPWKGLSKCSSEMLISGR